MAAKYDEAIAALHRAPFEAFVAERKRLTAELEASGDKAGAARLSKLTRPPISTWAVNQLFWRERKAFDALFRTAERLRDVDADADATAAHRDAITKLRARAASLLTEAGKSATEATLRRVTSTLTALAATGGFDPDLPGALRGDRDPPGFDVAGLSGFGVRRPEKSNGKRQPAAARRESAAAKRKEKAEARAEERRIERERAQKAAERERLERKVRIAKGVLEARKEELARLKEKLVETEEGIEGAREIVRELEKELKRS